MSQNSEVKSPAEIIGYLQGTMGFCADVLKNKTADVEKVAAVLQRACKEADEMFNTWLKSPSQQLL